MSVSPAPVSVQPSGQAIGNDGNWYTFTIRVGTPAQQLEVLPSTLTAESLVVNLQGCANSGFSNCAELRGGLFENSTSSTWQPLVNGLKYSLGIDPGEGISTTDGGYYGYDQVGITTTEGAGIVLNKQVVANYATTDLYVGVFGLSRKPSEITDNDPPSYLTQLFDNKQIPSLAYSYTAGAFYRSSLPSLTLGGQDLALFEPNDFNFTMASSGDRDLVLGVQAIGLEAGGESESLLTDGIMMFIDTTQPYLWLPQSACDAFAKAFGLQQSEITTRYTLNKSSHDANIALNASMVFQLGNSVEGGDSINITFPYAAFDLNFTDMATSEPEPEFMFPIRAQSDAQGYTIGRAFLQEAYLSVNYEYSNFSIYQAVPQTKDHQAHIVPLPAMGTVTNTGSGAGPTGTGGTTPSSGGGGGGSNAGAIAGGVVGGLFILAALLLGFCLWRRKQRRGTDDKPHPGGVVETSFDAPDSGSPQGYTSPRPPMQETDYFGPEKGGASFTSKPYQPIVSSDSSARAELESEHGYSSGLPSPRDATTAYHQTHQELAGEAPVLHELPTRGNSVRLTARMSNGPSPSLSPNPPGVLPASPDDGGPAAHAATQSWGEGTHLEDSSLASPSGRPSMMSANSITIMYPGSPSIVSHNSRSGRGSPRVQSYSSASPTHSAGPSMDDTILRATARGFSTQPDEPISPLNPMLPLMMAPLGRAHADRSQDTLVDSNGNGGGRHSPVARRRPDPELEPPTPVDDFVTNSPEHGSLGYGAHWPPIQRSRDQ